MLHMQILRYPTTVHTSVSFPGIHSAQPSTVDGQS